MIKSRCSWFDVLNISVLVVLGLCTLYPFWYVFIYSISDPQAAARGIHLLPAGFTLKNYTVVFENPNIFNSFFISVSRTVIGTIITIIASSLLAYCLSNNKTPHKRLMYRMILYSMYFNAGIIPWYITMRAYGLGNNFLLYVLPYAIMPFYVILFKAYFDQLPKALEESAMIDGAGYLRIYSKIILPVSLPIIATIGLFSAVGHWNMWFDNFFLVHTNDLMTLQLLLLNFLTEFSAAQSAVMANVGLTEGAIRVTPTSIRMTITMVAVLPIFCVYPFLQKYFIKGIMLGAIKG